MRRGGVQKKDFLEGAIRDHGGLEESGRECRGPVSEVGVPKILMSQRISSRSFRYAFFYACQFCSAVSKFGCMPAIWLCSRAHVVDAPII
jgi:hypothetical protein